MVEVLSGSTEEYDRGEKREHYQQIESLREYLLIAQDRRRVEVFERVPDGTWAHRTYGPGDAIELPSLGISLSTDELYDAAGVDAR